MINCWIHYGWRLKQANSKSKSGAVLVNVLAVMVTLLLLFLAAFTFVTSRYSIHVKEQNRLVALNLSEAGLTRWLYKLSQEKLETDTINYETPNGGSVSAALSAWGPFGLVISRGKFANQVKTSYSLVGSKPNALFDAAITVADESLPLVASGNTRIIGDVNSGALGLTTGRMRGEAIVREDFHTGNVVIHQALVVPKIDSTCLERYLSEANKRKEAATRVLPGSAHLTPKDSQFFSNFESVIVENNLRLTDISLKGFPSIKSFFVNGFVEITGQCRLSGLIEIIAQGPIYMKDSSLADYLILSSPDSIIISGNAIFSAIAISETKIVIEEKARLTYPSLLFVRDGDNAALAEAGIFLKSRSPMESVCYAERNFKPEDEIHPYVYLDTNSTFTGIIVSESQVDLRGKMAGSVYAERFQYFAVPTTYVNWLNDFQIDRGKLKYDPTLPMLINSSDSATYAVARTDFTL